MDYIEKNIYNNNHVYKYESIELQHNCGILIKYVHITGLKNKLVFYLLSMFDLIGFFSSDIPYVSEGEHRERSHDTPPPDTGTQDLFTHNRLYTDSTSLVSHGT